MKKWRKAVFPKAKFSSCFGKSEWYSLCLISRQSSPSPLHLDVFNSSPERSHSGHSGRPSILWKELSDLVFPVLLRSPAKCRQLPQRQLQFSTEIAGVMPPSASAALPASTAKGWPRNRRHGLWSSVQIATGGHMCARATNNVF